MDLRRVLESAGTGSVSEAAPAPASPLGARLSVAVVVLYRRWWWRRWRWRERSKGGAQHERDAKAAHEALSQETQDARGYSRATRRFRHTSLRSTNEGAHGAARLRGSRSCARPARSPRFGTGARSTEKNAMVEMRAARGAVLDHGGRHVGCVRSFCRRDRGPRDGARHRLDRTRRRDGREPDQRVRVDRALGRRRGCRDERQREGRDHQPDEPE